MPFLFLRISELLRGEMREDGSIKTPLREKYIRKVRLIGVITDRIDSSNETIPSYTFLRLDDGSGQIQLQAFAKKRKMMRNIEIGDSVLVEGKVDKCERGLFIRPRRVRRLSFSEEIYHRSRILLNYFLQFNMKGGIRDKV